jgi:prepilin-type processing-associated H-X9-DG protein
MVELLVAVAIVGLIVASIVPYVLSLRETADRQACAQNLRIIRDAMATYRAAYGTYPRTRSDPAAPAWTAYSGADDPNPFARDSAVKPNDVTASLWLLVRNGYLADPAVFVCPSTSDWADSLRNAAGGAVKPGDRANFRSKDNLSYSMTSPFNVLWADTEWSDTLASKLVVLADMNPGTVGRRDDVTKPVAGDGPKLQAWANSANHAKAGQNVLYADGNVSFEPVAFCGVEYLPYRARSGDAPEQPRLDGDNIYTSLTAVAASPAAAPATRPSAAAGPGVFGPAVGPSWKYDSYLVPSDDD